MRRQDILNQEPPRLLLTNVEFPLGQRSIKMRYVAKESQTAITRFEVAKEILLKYWLVIIQKGQTQLWIQLFLGVNHCF